MPGGQGKIYLLGRHLYNDYKKKKKKTQQHKNDTIWFGSHVQTLLQIFVATLVCHSKYYIFCTHTETLVSGMNKYQKFLQENLRAQLHVTTLNRVNSLTLKMLL